MQTCFYQTPAALISLHSHVLKMFESAYNTHVLNFIDKLTDYTNSKNIVTYTERNDDKTTWRLINNNWLLFANEYSPKNRSSKTGHPLALFLSENAISTIAEKNLINSRKMIAYFIHIHGVMNIWLLFITPTNNERENIESSTNKVVMINNDSKSSE